MRRRTGDARRQSPSPAARNRTDVAAVPVSGRWVGLGMVTIGVLTLIDVASGLAREGGALRDNGLINVSGTLALAPALASVGATRRQTARIAVTAVLMALLLCWYDGVMWFPALVRVVVVLFAGVVATVVAGVRTAQIAQLQDRREAARTLQAAMLTDLPAPDHLQLACRYLPASSGDQVGGDWYDALVDADGATTVVVGDVTGHDIRAAASMGQVRAMLRAYAVEGGQSPARLLDRVERALDRLGLEVLATVVVVRVEPPADGSTGTRTLRFSSAGHPPPVLLQPDGSVEVLARDPDVVLGVGSGEVRRDATCALNPGATLLLFTDGLVERRDEDIDVGLARLAASARDRAGTPLEELLDGVLEDVLGTAHLDDVALLGLRPN